MHTLPRAPLPAFADLITRADDGGGLLDQVGQAAHLHAAGHCPAALSAAATAWSSWQATQNGGTTIGVSVAGAYLTMLVGCRQIIAAHAVLNGMGALLPTDRLCTAASTGARAAHHMVCRLTGQTRGVGSPQR